MQSNSATALWVKYARNNLEAAIRDMRLLCNPRLRPYELILYNCHQSAEKMLKAYLLANSGAYMQIHDLHRLRIMCSQNDSTFGSKRIVDHCTYLSMFWNVKYPDVSLAVDASHATRGINSAKRVFDFVSERLGNPKVYYP
jgi:HEPN domain-containing protein